MAAPATGKPARKPRRRWRWHVPPALVHGNESLEGTELLEEFTGAMGLALWQSARDVTLWALVREPEERLGLFQPGAHEQRLRQIELAGVDAAIDAPLRTLARITRDPGAIDEGDVLSACHDVSMWAEQNEKPGTATAFAQAGALASPTNAAAGFRVGKLARNKGEYPRAESWFRRVIGLGRQAKDWASYAEAFVGLGNLYTKRGNHPAAKRFHIRGLRAAKRHGLRDIQGRAYHDLFVIAVYNNEPVEALEAARGAFKAYGPSHERLPVLAHDLGYFWLTRGRFEMALRVCKAVLPHITKPHERLLTVADIGRAAGAAGDRAEFDWAWDEVWNFAGDWYNRQNAAQALLDLSRGAISLKDWARAERAASLSRDVAVRTGESRVVIEVEPVLDQATRKRVVETAIEPAAGDQEAADSDTLAADLLRLLAVPRR
ncbi:MAG TPA: tetratricopeptide repeat protein [Longimicrobium sp.]|nr:tetratricopeptide repeat protein [Longimicrobium sp.]